MSRASRLALNALIKTDRAQRATNGHLYESEEDYAIVCDAMHAANTFRLEGDL